MRAAIMADNTDVSEVHDGKITDMRIEALLSLVFQSKYNEEHFDTLFNEIVRDFIAEDCPTILASVAGKQDATAAGLYYLSLLQLDYSVTHAGSRDWPIGGFEYLPQATVAISIAHLGGRSQTDMSPGQSVNQAAVAAILQLCRELSWTDNNQGNLFKH